MHKLRYGLIPVMCMHPPCTCLTIPLMQIHYARLKLALKHVSRACLYIIVHRARPIFAWRSLPTLSIRESRQGDNLIDKQYQACRISSPHSNVVGLWHTRYDWGSYDVANNNPCIMEVCTVFNCGFAAGCMVQN